MQFKCVKTDCTTYCFSKVVDIHMTYCLFVTVTGMPSGPLVFIRHLCRYADRTLFPKCMLCLSVSLSQVV
jgi:hypothetical protein